MTNGGVGIDGLHAAERHPPPGPLPSLPIERRPPTVLLHLHPRVAEPQLGTLVASVGDELYELSGGNEARCQLERMNETAMARILVVEAKAAPLESDAM